MREIVAALKHFPEKACPGRSRMKDGVAELALGLAEGKTRGIAYDPGAQRLVV
jgi:hypothetical protein